MGAIEQSSAVYITVSEGKFVRRFLKPTEKSISRITKTGKEVHEEFYKGWAGRITELEFKEHKDYGEFLNITIDDGDNQAMIQLKLNSGYATAFMKMLPNIDLQSDVTLSPTFTQEGDKKKSGMFVNQNGQAVKWYYTKDTPNGIPELRKIKVKGKDTWDDTDIIDFLKEMVNGRRLELRKGRYDKTVAAPVAAYPEDDDLPF